MEANRVEVESMIEEIDSYRQVAIKNVTQKKRVINLVDEKEENLRVNDKSKEDTKKLRKNGKGLEEEA